MNNRIIGRQKKIAIDEEELFKILGHQIRRDVIKFIGNKNNLTFTEIKNFLGQIDSPTLSYHLKSMNMLLYLKNNKYRLSDIGRAAFNLLIKADHSQMISKYKKHFISVYIITVVSWISIQTLVPIYYHFLSPECQIPSVFILIEITLNAVAIVNYILIWKLKKI
ncbi:MAG: ArsR family transcriptional regulator [Promethearchaeota archaeon]|nr:MAG: ArsR family transcriptional regulator [Candidatus Lokiarchaeota archaeon]